MVYTKKIILLSVVMHSCTPCFTHSIISSVTPTVNYAIQFYVCQRILRYYRADANYYRQAFLTKILFDSLPPLLPVECAAQKVDRLQSFWGKLEKAAVSAKQKQIKMNTKEEFFSQILGDTLDSSFSSHLNPRK